MDIFSQDNIILLASIIFIFFIIYIIIKYSSININDVINTASRKTQFGETYFDIYDKSTEEICDRLIIVQPFNWQIWAKNGEVFILVDTNYECPLNTTPATVIPNLVYEDSSTYNFKSVCLHSLLEDIVDAYTKKIVPIKISFEIEELQAEQNKFTILDALNFLFTKYLTMSPPTNTFIIKHENNHSHKKLLTHYIKNNHIFNIYKEKYFKSTKKIDPKDYFTIKKLLKIKK